MSLKRIALGVLVLAVSVSCNQSFAAGNIFAPIQVEDATQVVPPTQVNVNSSNKAIINGANLAGQTVKLQAAVSQLDNTQADYRRELTQVQSKYSEIDKRYQMVKLERKLTKQQIKAIEKKLKSLEKAKKEIKKNVTTGN